MEILQFSLTSSLFACFKALLYMVKVMDTVVDSPYVVVYFHTLSSGANHPPMSYLKYAYSMLDYRSVLFVCVRIPGYKHKTVH